MTTPPLTTPESIPAPTRFPLATRLPLLGLYPAKYRAAYGEEIAAVFAETVQDLGPGTALREWAALASHALRLRTRLSSTDPAGRIAAGAAPFILAGAASLNLLILLSRFFLPVGLILDDGGSPVIRTTLVVARTSPWILALIFVSLGRWTPARILVLLGILGWVVPTLAFTRDPELYKALPFFLLPPFGIVPGTLLLIAPPDAVDLSPRGRRETVLTALAVAVPLSALAIAWAPPGDITTYTPLSPTELNLLDASNAWPVAVMSLALLLHLGARRPDRLRAAGIALAVLPWPPMLSPDLYFVYAPTRLYIAPGYFSHHTLRNAGIVLAFLTTATLLAYLRHLLRRSRPNGPSGLA